MKCIRAGLYKHTNFVTGVVRIFLTNRRIHLEVYTKNESREAALPLS